MSMLHISILKTLLVMTAFLGRSQSFWENCIGERCFTITGPTEIQDFEGAKDWCKQRNSSLAIVSDNDTQEALVQYLLSSQLNEQPKLQLFIDLKLKQHDTTWYIINGSKYLGGLVVQNSADYEIYGYLNHYPERFQVDGSKPTVSRNFICQFEDARCSINPSNSHLDKDGCFVKYENESLTWFKAREKCRNNGGELAEFNFNSRTACCPLNVPIDTSWLNSSLNYWVGIRYRNRYWKSSVTDDEVIYTSWLMNEPNNNNSECVCVDPTGNPAWWWTDCDCTESRQFVCLKNVPTTIATTTTTTPSTTTSKTVSGSSVGLSVTQTSSSSQPINVLAIGLGVGIGGGVFLILLVVIVVLAVYFARRRRTKNNDSGTGNKFDNTPSTATSNITPAAPTGTDIYAQVVPTTNRPTNKKSENDVNDVIYSRPEFSSSENSAQHGSDMKKTRQDKALSVVLEGPSNVYANAASVS